MTSLDIRTPAPTRPTTWHRPLMLFTTAMIALTVVSVGGLLFDGRMLAGVPIWLKPFKFSVSFALYSFTLAWLISMQRRARRIGAALGTIVAVSGAAEIAFIVLQVVRGRASHFNISTPFDETVYDVMGVLAGLVFLATLVLAVLLAVEPADDRARRWSVRFGLVLSLIGMGLATLMLGNVSPAEVAAMHAGTPTMLGGHSIGVPDGEPAMPITGWSTAGGDLRIPHFVGLHGLQALPLLGLLLTALASRFPVLRDERVRIRLLVVGAVGYAGLIGLVLWQALRGQSIVHPDGLTLAAFATLVLLVAGSATAVLARRTSPGSASFR